MTQPADDRHLVLVIGAGRSGTSLVAGVFQRLGFHIPQPEVEANATNPRGFGEPRWVVNFHAKLMVRYGIQLFDARPAAWEAAARVLGEPVELGYCRTWTGWQFDESAKVVVKDPRTSWFLPMWLATAAELDTRLSLVTPLRHPSEVLTSVDTTDRGRHSDATKLAWWLNMMLTTELQTRDTPRAYLLYDDLLADWRGALAGAGQALGVDLVAGAGEAGAAAVDELVDPSLRRAARGWDGLEISDELCGLAEATWKQFADAATAGGDTDERRAALDELRASYLRTYAEAEQLAESTTRAAVRAAQQAAEESAGPREPTRAAANDTRRSQLRRALGRAKRAAVRVTGGGSPRSAR